MIVPKQSCVPLVLRTSETSNAHGGLNRLALLMRSSHPVGMRKEEFERRAAKMRADRAAATATSKPTNTLGKRTTANADGQSRSVLTIPTIPTVAPCSLMSGVWKPVHTKLLLAELGDAHPLVVRAVRAIASQQVRFDGLVYLIGDGVIDVAASPTALPEALRLFDLFIRTEQRGGEVSVTKLTTIKLDGEATRSNSSIDRILNWHLRSYL